MRKRKCKFCVYLVEDTHCGTPCYRCGLGFYDADKDYTQWYGWSGICRPNKAVGEIETKCQAYESRYEVER